MLVAAFLFAAMGACVKLAAAHYAVAELVLYRALFGLVALYAYARLSGLTLSTPHAAMHLRRSVVGVISLGLWFYAISILPISLAMTLNYTSPLFLATLTIALALAAGRAIAWPMVATIALGFAGVVLLLQPSFETGHQWVALAGLASGFFSAAAYWHVKALGRLGEPEWRVVFYFMIGGAMLGAVGSAFSGFSAHSGLGIALLLAIGATATLAQLAMTRAFGRGRTLLAASLQFSAVLFSAAIGVLWFDEVLGTASLAGIGLIVVGGVAATALTATAVKPPEPVAARVATD